MDERLEELFGEFTGTAPAPAESIALLEQHFEKFRKKLPADLSGVLQASDGAEGFINKHYLMLWGVAEILECNKSYEVNLYAAGLLLFGSSGGGEAYAFDTRPSNAMPVVKVPFVGMALKYADLEAPTFTDFLEKLRGEMSADLRRNNQERLKGQEIFEVKPILLGGSPTDPKNKAFLNRKQHIEAVRYWNDIIKELRAQSK